MVFQVIPSVGGVATANSISIPQTDLAAFGVTSAEMTSDDTGLARSVLGVLKKIQDSNYTSVIGISHPANPTFSANGVGINNWTYSLTNQILINKKTGNVSQIPLPTTGANSGFGGVAIKDTFLGAAVVDSGDSISGAALLIPTADLAEFDGSIVHGSLNLDAGQDNRNVFAAMYQMFATNLALRTTTIASAFTVKTVGNLSTVTIPSNFTAATDPLTSISSNDVSKKLVTVLSQAYSVTIQTSVNNANDTVDVRVVTA